MALLNPSRRLALPLVVILLVTIFASIGSDASEWLRFDRDAILSQGQYWRLISGHFVHLGWSHLGMNVAGLVLIWLLFGALLNTWEWIVVLFAGALVISLCLLGFQTQLRWYVGLSGVLHTLFVVGCIFEIQRRRFDGVFLLLAVSLKLAYEMVFGPLPGSEATAGGNVIVEAHFYGALSGLILVPLLHLCRLKCSADVAKSG